MIAEILFALRHRGPGEIIHNIRAMKRARAPIRGYVTTNCLWALMDIGLMDRLEASGTLEIERFCDEEGLDPARLREICLYLSRLGYLLLEGSRIELTPAGKVLWGDAQGVLSIFLAYEDFFTSFRQLLRKQGKLSDIKRRDELVARGFRETGPRLTFPVLGDLIKTMGIEGVIELGCGNIDLSSYLARSSDRLRLLGIDRNPAVLARARQTIQEEGLEGRVTLLERDIFELEASEREFAPYQLVTAIDLFHAYYHEGRPKLLDLFARLKRAFAGKRFLISEICLPDEETMKRIAYPHVEHELFHALSGQRTFEAGELEGLLKQCGFVNLQTWSLRQLGARIFVQFDA